MQLLNLWHNTSIARNNIDTNIHVQTSRNLNRVKQDMLLVHDNIVVLQMEKWKWRNLQMKHDERASVGEKIELF